MLITVRFPKWKAIIYKFNHVSYISYIDIHANKYTNTLFMALRVVDKKIYIIIGVIAYTTFIEIYLKMSLKITTLLKLYDDKNLNSIRNICYIFVSKFYYYMAINTFLEKKIKK